MILRTIEIQKYIKSIVTVAFIYVKMRFLRRGSPGDGCSFKVVPGDNITRHNGFWTFFFLRKAEVERTHSSGLLFTVTVFEVKTDVLL